MTKILVLVMMMFIFSILLKQVWQKITDFLNEHYGHGRSIKQVKQKWFDLYDKFKKTKTHAFGTGGGPKQPASFWDQHIERICGHQTSLRTGVQGKYHDFNLFHFFASNYSVR